MDTKERLHADFAPSSFSRFIHCPASFQMTKDLPEETNVFAEEGTMLHERCEKGFNIEGLTQEQASCVERAQKFMKEMLGNDYFLEEKEERLSVMYDKEELTFGTVDFIALSSDGTKAKIMDFKFGRVPVLASKDNWQLILYAIAVMQKYKVEEVETYIFQPRVSPSVTGYSFSSNELSALLFIAHEAKMRCISDTLVFNADAENQCKYCKAKDNCPAFMMKYSANIVAVNDASALSNDKLIDLYEKTDAVSKQLYSQLMKIKAEMEVRIQSTGIPGYTLKEGAKSIKINDINAVYHVLKDIIPYEAFISACELKKTELESLYISEVKKQRKASMSELKSEFNTLISIYSEVKQNKPSIVKVKS